MSWKNLFHKQPVQKQASTGQTEADILKKNIGNKGEAWFNAMLHDQNAEHLATKRMIMEDLNNKWLANSQFFNSVKKTNLCGSYNNDTSVVWMNQDGESTAPFDFVINGTVHFENGQYIISQVNPNVPALIIDVKTTGKNALDWYISRNEWKKAAEICNSQNVMYMIALVVYHSVDGSVQPELHILDDNTVQKYQVASPNENEYMFHY